MTLTDIRIKINKLSHKNKFIVGSKPEFESSQQNHPFEHIRNCPHMNTAQIYYRETSL